MTIEEVVEIAKAGAQQGCTEALFTLGEHHHSLVDCWRCSMLSPAQRLRLMPQTNLKNVEINHARLGYA